MKIIEQRERLLHRHEVRTSKDQLEDLLHPDFVEIGYSGRTWDYKTTIHACLEEDEPEYAIYATNYEFEKLSDTVVQVFYEGGHQDCNGSISRCAKRMSLWFNVDGIWKMRYHQATPVEELTA